MSTVRVGAIRFKIYPNDHGPRHVHAFIGAGEVIVDLRLDGTLVLARRKRGPIRGAVTRSEVRDVLIRRRTHSVIWSEPGKRCTMKTSKRVRTTDAEIDAAIASSRRWAQPVAVAATYGAGKDEVVIRFQSGATLCVPRELLQGLAGARVDDLREIVIEGPGTGLHWPRLDVDHSIPALLDGVFGTQRWMRELGRRGGAKTSAAKAAAARENGRRGGRPRTRYQPQISYDTRNLDAGETYLPVAPDTTVATLRREYGPDFAAGLRGDMKLKTLLERARVKTLESYLRKRRKRR